MLGPSYSLPSKATSNFRVQDYSSNPIIVVRLNASITTISTVVMFFNYLCYVYSLISGLLEVLGTLSTKRQGLKHFISLRGSYTGRFEGSVRLLERLCKGCRGCRVHSRALQGFSTVSSEFRGSVRDFRGFWVNFGPLASKP